MPPAPLSREPGALRPAARGARRHPQALRDLSVRSNNVGEIERDLGNPEAARTAYRESLELRRRRREALGDTPQALRNLSVSLDNVGRTEGDRVSGGRRIAYRESLEFSPSCARRSATARRHRGIFGFARLCRPDGGRSGNPEAARTAYRGAWNCAGLREAFGDTPQVLRDL